MFQVEIEQFKSTQGKHYSILEAGKSCSLRKQITDHLQKKKPFLEEVNIEGNSNVILVFCPIVSRAGTDIEAAVTSLNKYSANKPAIFMVFHHTFRDDIPVPDSSRCVNRRNTLTVDCLFNEDNGLLTCDKNIEALAKIVGCFTYQEGCCEWLQRILCSFCGYLRSFLCCGEGNEKNAEERRLMPET